VTSQPFATPPGQPVEPTKSEVKSYLNGAPVDFKTAVREGLRNTFTYKGRASRSAFWFMQLFIALICFVLPYFFFPALRSIDNDPNFVLDIIDASAGVLFLLVAGGLTITMWSSTIRRLHDIDFSGWWFLLIFVPIGGIFLIIFACTSARPGPNRFNVRQ
jgi:uncharacterized membrane protein YhaH (DUF805 family)